MNSLVSHRWACQVGEKYQPIAALNETGYHLRADCTLIELAVHSNELCETKRRAMMSGTVAVGILFIHHRAIVRIRTGFGDWIDSSVFAHNCDCQKLCHRPIVRIALVDANTGVVEYVRAGLASLALGQGLRQAAQSCSTKEAFLPIEGPQDTSYSCPTAIVELVHCSDESGEKRTRVISNRRG